jgi:hypothetical protein
MSIILWAQFLLLGITGIYMRQVVKINTAVFLRDISKWNMVLGILLLITQFVLGIAFI